MTIQKIIKTIYNTLGYEVMAVNKKGELYLVELDDNSSVEKSILQNQEGIINQKLQKDNINIKFA